MNVTSLLSLALITVLVGCGEDSGGTRRRGSTYTPPVTPDNFIVPSNIHKSRERTVLESRAVSNLLVTGTLPDGYRIVPVMATDDEGASSTDVRTRTSLGRPETNCGTGAGLTVAQRISNCASLNSTRSTWAGSFGGSGEGTWRLVTKVGAQEIWVDHRTGLLWSHIVGLSNWCNASGNKKKEDVPIVDCSQLGKEQLCVGQQILGLSGVVWRLPTRNDYLLADLDGLRYVLSDANDSGLWTATMDSSSGSRTHAWVYIQEQGTLESGLLTETRQVRCVGSAVL